MRLAIVAAGAAALSLTASEPATGQPASGAADMSGATGWWYAGQAGQAPARQLIFIDRSTVRARGGEASLRAMQVFEQPRGDVRAYAITYEFRCGARRFQSRDALFTTTGSGDVPESGIVDAWSAAVPGSTAALLLDAACFGRFESAARRIAGAPTAEAGRMFRAAPVTASTTPARPALPSNAAPTLEGCLQMPPGPASEACITTVLEHDREAMLARLPRNPLQCSGDILADGNFVGRFSATLSFVNGDGIMSLRPDPFRLSGRYMAAGTGDHAELFLPNDIRVRYTFSPSQLRSRFTHYWTSEEYMGPQAGLVNAGNPFAPVQMQNSDSIELLAHCT